MSQEVLYCANHPKRETTLRCNRCGKPICAQCAVQTPVGYRCRECVRGQQRGFETARKVDFPLAALISALGVGLATALLSYLGFWGLFVAPVVGGGVAEVVRWAVRRRRSRRLPLFSVVGGVIGVILYLLLALFPDTNTALSILGNPDLSILVSLALSSLWPLINGALMLSALYYRLRGILI